MWSKSAHSVLLVWLKPGADSSLSSRSALPGGAAGVGVTSTQQYELQMALHEEDGTVGEFQSVFFGRECKFDVNNLEPATDHSFRVRAEGPGAASTSFPSSLCSDAARRTTTTAHHPASPSTPLPSPPLLHLASLLAAVILHLLSQGRLAGADGRSRLWSTQIHTCQPHRTHLL